MTGLRGWALSFDKSRLESSSSSSSPTMLLQESRDIDYVIEHSKKMSNEVLSLPPNQEEKKLNKKQRWKVLHVVAPYYVQTQHKLLDTFLRVRRSQKSSYWSEKSQMQWTTYSILKFSTESEAWYFCHFGSLKRDIATPIVDWGGGYCKH